MSAFLQIASRIAALLQQAPAISPNVFQARNRVLAAELDSALNVQFDGAQPHPGAIRSAPVDWQSTFTVECYARSTTSGGDAAVDPLLAGVYQRLAADTTLGGLVTDLGSPQIEAEYDAQAQKTGWVRMTYQVKHRTANLTLD